MIDKFRFSKLVQNIKGQFNKDCIVYFTQNVPKTSLSLCKVASFKNLVDRFNLEAITFSEVLNEGDELKKNPDQVLPKILKFDRKIDQSYFTLMIELSKSENLDYFTTKNIIEIFPLIYRFLVCVSHQIDDSFVPISQGLETSSIPPSFLKVLSVFIIMIRKLPDFYSFPLINVIKIILWKLAINLNDIFTNDTQEYFVEDLLMLSSEIKTTLSISILPHDDKIEFIEFSLQMFIILVKYNKLSPKNFNFLIDFLNFIIGLFNEEDIEPNDNQRSLAVLIDMTFNLIITNKFNENSNELSLILLKMFNYMSNNFNGNINEIATTTEKYIEWVLKNTVEVQNTSKDNDKGDTFSNTIVPSKFEIIEAKTIDKDVLSKYNSNSKQEKGENNSGKFEFLDEYSLLLQDTMENNTTFLIDFCNSVFDSLNSKSNPPLQMFIIGVLLKLSTQQLGKLISSINSIQWAYLFNEYSFSSSTKTDELYSQLNTYSFQLVKKAFSTESSNLNQLLMVIFQHFNTNYPQRVKEIIDIFYILVKDCPNNFCKALDNIQTWPILIQADLIYTYEIINSTKHLDLLRYIHTKIILIVLELSKNKEINDTIFSNDLFIEYILSLNVEKDSCHLASLILRNVLKNTKNQLVLEKCTEFMGIILKKGSKYASAYINIVEAFCSGIQNSNTCIIDYFASENMTEKFSITVKGFSDSDLENNQRFSIIAVTLNTFLFFCQYSNDNIKTFSNAQNVFIESFSHAISKIQINEALIDILISLCLNEITTFQIESHSRTIRNTSALLLLYNTTKMCVLSDRIFAYLLAIISTSVENCWHCYISGFLLHLINDISDSTPHIVFELINAIGSRFFGLVELTAIFQQLKKIKSSFSKELVETVYNMYKTRINFPLSSGFYVENETKRYFTPSFSRLKQFQLSFNINIKKYAPLPILKIHSPKESITFSIDSNLSVKFKKNFSVQEKFFTSQEQLKLENSNNVIFKLVNGEIIISVNNVLMENLKDFSFNFTSDPISFELLDRDKLQSACKYLTITKIETFGSQPLIFDHSVPFPLSFSKVLPLAGGPQIFLPFLEMVKDSVYPKRVFLKYLQIIGLTIKDEEAQVNPSFFRAFGHLLKHIPMCVWSEFAFNEINSIALRLQQPRLIIAMLQHILLDFSFWDKFSNPLKTIILDKTILTIMDYMNDIFISSIDFDMLLIRIYKVFENGKNDYFRQTFINILNSYKSLSNNSVNALLSRGFEKCAFQETALGIVFSHIKTNNETVFDILERYGSYLPFMELALESNENIIFWSLNIIFYIYKGISPEEIPIFSQYLLTLGRDFNRKITIDPFLNLTLGFATGEINYISNIPTSNIQVCYDYTIKYPEFFMLFLCFALLTKSRPSSYGEIIIKSICNSRETRDNIKRIDNWMLWVALFFAMFSTPDEFGSKLAIFAIDDAQSNNLKQYYMFIILVSTRFNWNWRTTAGNFVFQLLERMPCSETYKLGFIFLCFSYNCENDAVINVNSYSANINAILDKFYKPLLSPITVAYNVSSDLNKIYQVQMIFTVLINKTIEDPSILSSQIEITPNNSVSFSSILVFLLDSYRKLGFRKSDEFISLISEHVASRKDTDITLATTCLCLTTFDIQKREKEQIFKYLIKSGVKTEKITEMANKTKLSIQKLFESILPSVQDELSKIFNNLLENKIKYSTKEPFIATTKKLVSESQGIFNELLKQEDTRNDQTKRQNAKVWNKISKSLKESGGAWSTVDKEQHWKLDQKVDILGRHYRLKKNRHFDDHKDASKQRDSGVKTPPKSKREPFKLLAPKDVELDSTPFFHSDCQMNTITCLYKGVIHLYKDSIVFESTETYDTCEEVQNETTSKFKNNVYEIDISDIKYVLNRSYMHRDCACEIFTKKMVSYFLIFPEGVRSKVYTRLSEKNIYVQNGPSSKVLKDFDVVNKWRKGIYSNYQYLYMVNMICGRSYNDLNQYPVFPWILSNYKSKTIDLKDPKNYRDLSKPIGAYDKERLENIMIGFTEIDDPTMKCMYRVFYSNPAQTIGYMVRMEPFTTLHIKLQSGQFDISGRLFTSIGEAWESVTHEAGDYRELIPEFFSLPDFLENQNHFDLGIVKSSGRRVDNVRLPPWAYSAAHFVHINRMALESPYVSSTLNQWIDLVFGYKQRGIEAEKAFNVFHPFSYPSIIEQKEIIEMLGTAVTSHSLNFGVVPSIGFPEPSPIRGNFTTEHTFDILFSPRYFESKHFATSVLIEEKDIITTSNDGRIIISKFSKNEIKVKREVQFPLKFISCFNSIKELSKRFLIIDSQFVVLAPPTENSFTLFDIRSSYAKTITESQEQPGIITALAADINKSKGTTELFIASAASDSSLFIYNYIFNEKTLQFSRTSLLVHKSSIIDVDISYKYDLIASIDNNTLAFTSLSSGKLIVSTPLKNVPSKVMISENGYVIVVSLLKENDVKTTKIVLYNSMGGMINHKERIGKCTAMTLYTDPNQEEYAMFCFSDNTFSVMSIFELGNIVQGELDKKVVSISSSKELDCAIVCQEDGILKIQPFNRREFESIISNK